MHNNSGCIHIIGSAVMDKHYNLKIADESIYSYLGAKAVPLFPAYIHPEDRELFTNALTAADKGHGKTYVTVRLKSFVDKYSVVIIFVRKSSIDPRQFYELNIYDLIYLAKEYEDIKTQLKKIKVTMQLLRPSLTFDYDPASDEITVYSDRDVVRFQGRVEELHRDILDRGVVDKDSLRDINHFFDSLRNTNEGMNYTLNMNTFSNGTEMQPVCIRTASILDKENNSVLSIVGVLSPAGETTSYDTRLINSSLDPLTGLYNKAAIKELAIEALKTKHKSIAYVMLDLDSFKEVNDTYGHMFGDEVILNVARIIRDVVGRDGYVGRVGGDEFFMVRFDMGTAVDELRPIFRSMRAQIEWAYRGKLGDIRLTASIGCASYGKDADNYDDLFKLADHCLYCAKTKGRDRFVIYNKAMHGSLEDIKAKDNSINIDRSISQRQKLAFVVDAVNRLNDWRKEVIESVISQMLKYFLISEVHIYDVKEGKAIYSAPGAPDRDEEENVCSYLEDIAPVFRESNVLVYCDYTNLKMPYRNLFDYVVRNDIYSLYLYAIKDKGEITHLAVIYSRGHYEKWSETDQNYFNIIFKTIGDKILN